MSLERALAQAAAALAQARSVVVTAAAGMGVDSGLPDFRGPEGFWRAYPPYEKLGLAFEDLANPRWFDDDPALAWGFYGHRLNLYRKTAPHDGFRALLDAAGARPLSVFTSNVDGAFQAAGYADDAVTECHGSIRWLQCTSRERARCGLWAAPPGDVDVDDHTMRARAPLPACPKCGALARPNILMFGDWGWDSSRTEAQDQRLHAWLGAHADGAVVVECGAGTAIPTVRRFGEALARQRGATLVRINVREPQGPDGTVSVAAGARDALLAICRAVRR